ncbi:MAG: GNAT family N-acetyltransferase [Clostridia bacterium]|nr:GNAT family N-acetyltransferase [Clostridia bacterium]
MDWIWSDFGCLPKEARRIREAVFMQEQGFCQEFDDVDAKSWHVLLRRNGAVIGTARMFSEDGNHSMHVGRVAVLKKERGGGSGSMLLTACCEKAAQLGVQKIILGAQCRAMKFYEKNGFQPFGDIYDDEGCPHQMMEKKI